MTQDPTARFTELERAEFERVVGELAKWPRLSHLLRYMGDKLFAGEVDRLNEDNIATDVLGRSKTVFNTGEDAIARVETHRLRKRLAAFYEGEGRDHPIQLSLPAGTYVPVFVHKHVQALSQASSGAQAHGTDSRNNVGRLRGWISRSWKLVVRQRAWLWSCWQAICIFAPEHPPCVQNQLPGSRRGIMSGTSYEGVMRMKPYDADLIE